LEPLSHVGPEPFRFTPASPVLVSRAYTRAFKVLATVIVGGCAVWLYLLWREGSLGSGARSTGLGWFTAGLMLMLYTWWHFMTSRTRLDSQALYQSWVWDKKMELADLAFCKLIRVRGLDWLIAPRLYARTLMGKFAVFYAADAHMIGEFERLVRELKEFRRL
jgi:hypothetical protein